jgi:hypothetical protein
MRLVMESEPEPPPLKPSTQLGEAAVCVVQLPRLLLSNVDTTSSVPFNDGNRALQCIADCLQRDMVTIASVFAHLPKKVFDIDRCPAKPALATRPLVCLKQPVLI